MPIFSVSAARVDCVEIIARLLVILEVRECEAGYDAYQNGEEHGVEAGQLERERQHSVVSGVLVARVDSGGHFYSGRTTANSRLLVYPLMRTNTIRFSPYVARIISRMRVSLNSS